MTRVATDDRGFPAGRTTREEGGAFRLGDLAIDDAFVDVVDGATLTVEDPERRVSVRFDTGYEVAQVYAPTTDDVISFEPMTAPIDALVRGDGLRIVAPGDSFTAGFTILVRST